MNVVQKEASIAIKLSVNYLFSHVWKEMDLPQFENSWRSQQPADGVATGTQVLHIPETAICKTQPAHHVSSALAVSTGNSFGFVF